jgi:TRAP-type C4-dicarboxylate transport system permease small subunit
MTGGGDGGERVAMSVGLDAPAAAPASPDAPALRIARATSKAARTLLGVLLLAMVVLNVANAVGRYAFGTVLAGADEILVYAMIWLVMVGLILVTVDRRNIGLDFLVNGAGPRGRHLLAIFHHAIMTAASAYAAVQCWAFVKRVAAIGQTSMAIDIPMSIPHGALVVGFGGTALAGLLLVVGDAAALLQPHAAKRRGIS